MPWLDRVMIDAEYGLEATGVFASLSEILTRVFSLLIYPLTLAVYPRVTMLWHQRDWKSADKILRYALLIGTGVSLFTVVVMHLAQSIVFKLLLPATTIMQAKVDPYLIAALTASGAIWSMGLLVHKPLELQSNTHGMLIAMGVALAVKIAGNLFGIPKWGMSGVAYASIVSGVVYCFACVLIATRDQSHS